MKNQIIFKRLISFMLSILILLMATGCSAGISQDEYDKVVAENADLRAQLSNYETVDTPQNNSQASFDTSNTSAISYTNDPNANDPSDFSYDINGYGVTITHYLGSKSDVIIPAVIEGSPVIAIGDTAFEYLDWLKSVTIPDSVTIIKGYIVGAFFKCTSLVSVNIGNSVTEIGYIAFYNCSSLTYINIPDSLKKIDNDAFAGCASIPNEIRQKIWAINPNATF